MVGLLYWISIISGGFLVVLLLLSIFGGLDLDFDIPDGELDVDADGGNLGVVKSLLTFVSIGSWVVKLVILGGMPPIVALAFGMFIGGIAVYLLSQMLKFFLGYQKNPKWPLDEALFKQHKVYLKIPAKGQENGMIKITINNSTREIKAITESDGDEVPTGALVEIVKINNDSLVTVKSVENTKLLESSSNQKDDIEEVERLNDIDYGSSFSD